MGKKNLSDFVVNRVVMSWRTKYPDNVIKGYKVNLQHALGTRIPNGLLNFFFKFNYVRKVSDSLKLSMPMASWPPHFDIKVVLAEMKIRVK